MEEFKMSTWFDVVEPHEDIKKGNFDEAIFAAKLGDVALGKAVVDYNEPSLFFKKTYFSSCKSLKNNKLNNLCPQFPHFFPFKIYDKFITAV